MQVAAASAERNAGATLQLLLWFLWDSVLPAGNRFAEELGSSMGSPVPARLLFGSTSRCDALGQGYKGSWCAHNLPE